MIAIRPARKHPRIRRSLAAATLAACAALLPAGCSKVATEPSPRTQGEQSGQPAAVATPSRSTEAATPLEILVENAADPFSCADGTGYANDLVEAAFAAVEVPVILTVVPYVRCKAMVLDGSAAVCFSMAWDPAFEGRVKFADVNLIEVQPVYYENPARPLVARSESELGASVSIGIVRGYEFPPTVRAAKDRGAIFVDGPSEIANLKKLLAGRLDAAMIMGNSFSGAEHWLTKAGVTGLVREAFKSASSEFGYLGVSTSHPRGLPALDQFNRGMAMIRSNGTFERITKKWSTPP